MHPTQSRMIRGNSSWTWTFVKTFFTTLPSTGPGSCIDVALSAAKGPLDVAKKVGGWRADFCARAPNERRWAPPHHLEGGAAPFVVFKGCALLLARRSINGVNPNQALLTLFIS